MLSTLALMITIFAGTPAEVAAPPATTLSETADVVAVVTVRSVVVDIRDGKMLRAAILEVDDAIQGASANGPLLTLIDDSEVLDGPIAGQKLLLYARKGPDDVLVPLSRTTLVPVIHKDRE